MSKRKRKKKKPRIDKPSKIKVEAEGLCVAILSHDKYRIRLHNDHDVICYRAGKLQKFRIGVIMGDKVTIEMSPYDFTKGRITYRHRKLSQNEGARVA